MDGRPFVAIDRGCTVKRAGRWADANPSTHRPSFSPPSAARPLTIKFPIAVPMPLTLPRKMAVNSGRASKRENLMLDDPPTRASSRIR